MVLDHNRTPNKWKWIRHSCQVWYSPNLPQERTYSDIKKNNSSIDSIGKSTPTAVSISDLVKQKSVGKEVAKAKATDAKPPETTSSESETVVHMLRSRLRKRHTQWKLRSTSQYINYSKYGTDSNTEDEAKAKNKKPRVGKWPSTTHEQCQVMITRSHLNADMPKHMTTKLISTAVSPKPIVKSEDSKYKVEIVRELSTEKHF